MQWKARPSFIHEWTEHIYEVSKILEPWSQKGRARGFSLSPHRTLALPYRAPCMACPPAALYRGRRLQQVVTTTNNNNNNNNNNVLPAACRGKAHGCGTPADSGLVL